MFYTRTVNDHKLFVPLPETRTEVKRIARQFSSSGTTLVFGKQASESTIKSGGLNHYRYLHFATHGILGS